jgi:hypothetical protein
MINFFRGFREFLGVPEEALRLCRINPDLEGIDKYTTESAGNALHQTADNAWRFGIEIIFGSEGGIEMREMDGCRFSLSLRGDTHLFFDINIEVREDEFAFTNSIDDKSPRVACKFDRPAANMAGFYSYLAGLVDGVFESKPWDGPKKIPIGFESTRRA